MSTEYAEWRALQSRVAVDPGPDEAVEGSLLVGTEPAMEFVDNQSSYGCDNVSIFPAFHNGARCWVRREDWEPAFGHSASGTQEFILSFEDGVKLFLEHGMFEFPVEGMV